MSTSDDITVRFPLTKGEGICPEKPQFTENELSDIRTVLAFSICWDQGTLGEPTGAKIVSLEFIYDGITPIEGEDFGYWFEDSQDYLCGYPAPIVRFKLDRPIDVEDFRRSIFTSSFEILTSSMVEDDGEPYFAEDYNGYTSVLSETERDDFIAYFKANNALSGKVFHFADGLPECGYSIPAMDFSLPQQTKKLLTNTPRKKLKKKAPTRKAIRSKENTPTANRG